MTTNRVRSTNSLSGMTSSTRRGCELARMSLVPLSSFSAYKSTAKHGTTHQVSGVAYGIHLEYNGHAGVHVRELPEEELEVMTYVITEPCISVKDAACVDVCP